VLGGRGYYSLPGPLLPSIHRSAWKSNARKFTVASDPPDAATNAIRRHGSTTSGSKRGTKYRSLHRNVARCCDSQHRNYPRNPALEDRFSTGLRLETAIQEVRTAVIECSVNSAVAATRESGRVGCASRGKPSREKDSVGLWWVRVGTPLVCLVLAALNMGRTGPIPQPTPHMGDPWAALVVGALLWALASVVVASESARGGMRRRTWGWVASFLTASLVAAYAFGKVV
jgi:hypothetical protein